jgi:flavin-dependent dehydrogenase
MVVTGEPAVSVEGHYGGELCGRALQRSVLDAALIAAAEQAGARIEQEVLVREPLIAGGRVAGLIVAARDGRSTAIRAALTIAADGASSRIARALRLGRHPQRPRRWAVGAYYEGVTGLRDLGEMHVRHDRYIGVAPLPGSLANACVVTADRKALRESAALVDRTVRTDPLLAERFRRAQRVTAPVSLGPLAVECATCGMPGLLLAGDAAGFIDPMTGDGLRFALRGAELAAAEALSALEHGHSDAHLRLSAARRREFARKWRFNRALRALVSSPAAVRAAAHGAVWAPRWLQHVIRYAGDLRAA